MYRNQLNIFLHHQLCEAYRWIGVSVGSVCVGSGVGVIVVASFGDAGVGDGVMTGVGCEVALGV